MTTPENDEELALYVISVAAQLSGLHHKLFGSMTGWG